MKYGKALISRRASTTCTPAMTAVIFANLRGTVRIKSVCAIAKIAGTKEWQSKRDTPLCAKLRQSAIHQGLLPLPYLDQDARGEKKHDKFRARKAPTEHRRRHTGSALTRYIGTIRRLVSGTRTTDEPPPGDSPKLCGTDHRN